MTDKLDLKVLREQWLLAALEIGEPGRVMPMARTLDRILGLTGSEIIDHWIKWSQKECTRRAPEALSTLLEECAEALSDIKKNGFEFAAAAVGDDKRAADVLSKIVNNPELLKHLSKDDPASPARNGQRMRSEKQMGKGRKRRRRGSTGGT